MSIETDYTELLKRCLEKHKALMEVAAQKCDHYLVLVHDEIKQYSTTKRSITKEMFCDYLRNIHSNVKEYEKLLDSLGKHFKDSYIVDDATYTLLDNVLGYLVVNTFNVDDAQALQECGYMVEMEWYTNPSKPGKVTYDNKEYLLDSFESLYVYMEEMYGRKIVTMNDDENLNVFENGHKFGTVEIDGRKYKTVKIANQEWLAENLCLETEKSYINPDHPEFGRYYEWDAIKEIQSRLPPGWRVPSIDDFNSLFQNIGGKYAAGAKLKSTTGWSPAACWMPTDWNRFCEGIDAYGFAMLPAGFRSEAGDFLSVGRDAYMWSASEDSSYCAYYQRFYFTSSNVRQFDGSKYGGFSVRVVRKLHSSMNLAKGDA